MSHRILVPLEGSARDAEALAMARHIARQLDAEIVLMHVAPILFDTRDVIAAEQRLDEYAQALRAEGIGAHFVMEYGDPSAAIAATGERQKAQMIVLAPEHRALLQTLWHPRVSSGLLGSATVPLFILPDVASEKVPVELLRDPDAIVIAAVDGSTNAELALPIAIQLAQAYARPLVLARIVAPVFIVGSGIEAMKARHDAQYAEEAEAHRYLTDTRQRLASEENISVETVELVGPVADQLIRLAASHPGSVLVMGTRGRSGLVRAVVGSVAAEVMSQATTPVVVVPPPPAGDSETK
ncbi:MAG TPA: universal stress protein [Ktedonobacterales bacterium]|nr:universal stress protein [Ktedonobacterales bacterium]